MRIFQKVLNMHFCMRVQDECLIGLHLRTKRLHAFLMGARKIIIIPRVPSIRHTSNTGSDSMHHKFGVKQWGARGADSVHEDLFGPNANLAEKSTRIIEEN
jgi:hypothetical protein